METTKRHSYEEIPKTKYTTHEQPSCTKIKSKKAQYNTKTMSAIQFSWSSILHTRHKKLDKKLISLTKKVYGLLQSMPNIAAQLPYEMFGMQATSFLTSYARTLGDQLTQALNDK